MKKQEEKPAENHAENLGVKIGTKEEKFWADVCDKTKHEIETLEKMLKFNKAILEMAEKKLIENKNG